MHKSNLSTKAQKLPIPVNDQSQKPFAALVSCGFGQVNKKTANGFTRGPPITE